MSTVAFLCPFCGVRATAVLEQDPAGDAYATHEEPTCAAYDDAEDALAFLAQANDEIARQSGTTIRRDEPS